MLMRGMPVFCSGSKGVPICTCIIFASVCITNLRDYALNCSCHIYDHTSALFSQVLLHSTLHLHPGKLILLSIIMSPVKRHAFSNSTAIMAVTET
ncbi:hypothetical protein FKM82_019241 [Ascaphus truei]